MYRHSTKLRSVSSYVMTQALFFPLKRIFLPRWTWLCEMRATVGQSDWQWPGLAWPGLAWWLVPAHRLRGIAAPWQPAPACQAGQSCTPGGTLALLASSATRCAVRLSLPSPPLCPSPSGDSKEEKKSPAFLPRPHLQSDEPPRRTFGCSNRVPTTPTPTTETTSKTPSSW